MERNEVTTEQRLEETAYTRAPLSLISMLQRGKKMGEHYMGQGNRS